MINVFINKLAKVELCTVYIEKHKKNQPFKYDTFIPLDLFRCKFWVVTLSIGLRNLPQRVNYPFQVLVLVFYSEPVFISILEMHQHVTYNS